ncbi:MAG: hypothetical protein QXP98_04690 [Thermoproteus sp.]
MNAEKDFKPAAGDTAGGATGPSSVPKLPSEKEIQMAAIRVYIKGLKEGKVLWNYGYADSGEFLTEVLEELGLAKGEGEESEELRETRNFVDEYLYSFLYDHGILVNAADADGAAAYFVIPPQYEEIKEDDFIEELVDMAYDDVEAEDAYNRVIAHYVVRLLSTSSTRYSLAFWALDLAREHDIEVKKLCGVWSDLRGGHDVYEIVGTDVKIVKIWRPGNGYWHKEAVFIEEKDKYADIMLCTERDDVYYMT